MPCEMVGEKHVGHGGLLVQVKKDRLNHLQAHCQPRLSRSYFITLPTYRSKALITQS